MDPILALQRNRTQQNISKSMSTSICRRQYWSIQSARNRSHHAYTIGAQKDDLPNDDGSSVPLLSSGMRSPRHEPFGRSASSPIRKMSSDVHSTHLSQPEIEFGMIGGTGMDGSVRQNGILSCLQRTARGWSGLIAAVGVAGLSAIHSTANAQSADAIDGARAGMEMLVQEIKPTLPRKLNDVMTLIDISHTDIRLRYLVSIDTTKAKEGSVSRAKCVTTWYRKSAKILTCASRSRLARRMNGRMSTRPPNRSPISWSRRKIVRLERLSLTPVPRQAKRPYKNNAGDRLARIVRNLSVVEDLNAPADRDASGSCTPSDRRPCRLRCGSSRGYRTWSRHRAPSSRRMDRRSDRRSS